MGDTPTATQIARMRRQRQGTYGLIDPIAGSIGPSGGAALWFATRAQMAAFAETHGVATAAWVEEVQAEYVYDPTTVAAGNGWTTVTGQFGALWRAKSTSLTLPIIGGTTDDWPNFVAAARACAASGVVLRLGPGTYRAKTRQLLCGPGVTASGLQIEATSRTIVDTTGLATASPLDAPFVMTQGTQTAANTLAGPVTVGARTLNLAAGTAAVGSILQLVSGGGAGQQVQTLTVRAAAGVAITVDRPILYPFQAADAANTIATVPTFVSIEGNGMTITGTGGGRAIELVASQFCTVEDVNVVPLGTGMADLVISADLGGLGNAFRRLLIDASLATANVTMVGIAFESQESGIVEDCIAIKCGLAGHQWYQSVLCLSRGAKSTACANGLSLTSNGPVTFGCQDCVVQGFSAIGSTAAGVAVASASNRNVIDGADLSFNASGCTIGDPGSTCSGNVLAHAFALSCTTAGIVVAATSRDTSLRRVETSNSAIGVNVGAGADVKIAGFTHTGTTAAFPNGQTLISAGAVVLRDFKLTPTTAIDVIALTGGSLDIAGGSISGGNGANLINLQSGNPTLRTAHMTMTVAGGGTGLVAAAGGKIFRGEQTDTSGCAIESSGAGAFNFGTFTLNGVTQVDVASACILVGAWIAVSLKTVGGTPGTAAPYYSAAQTAGHFFVKSPTAGANDVYNWIALT
jgi:hypothetical protein